MVCCTGRDLTETLCELYIVQGQPQPPDHFFKLNNAGKVKKTL